MNVLKSKYLTTVRRRLSEVALQPSGSVIEKPVVVRADIKVLLLAISSAEAELAKRQTASSEEETAAS